MEVYPNPAQERTAISGYLPKADQLRIDVFNVKGELVSTRTTDSIQGVFGEELEVEDFARGIYFISVRGEVYNGITRVFKY